MGRGTRNHDHALKEEIQNGVYSDTNLPRMEKIPECGEAHVWRFAFAGSRHQCPKCSEIVSKRILAETFPNITMGPMDEARKAYYRSVYPIFDVGVQVAWMVMDNGWGAKWTLRKMAYAPVEHGGEPVFSIGSVFVDSLPSKSSVLVKAAECRVDGSLKTKDEIKASAFEADARRKVRVAAAQAHQLRIGDAHIEVMEGLKALDARSDLSNIERAAVTHLYRHMTHEDGTLEGVE